MTQLTHLDEHGQARMVDVGAKPATARQAVASGRIRMSPQALAAIRAGDAPKGDVLAAARIAGIMAAKKTAELIPLCHPLALDSVTLDFAFEADALRATATAASPAAPAWRWKPSLPPASPSSPSTTWLKRSTKPW